jgi:hypothetical protein
MEKIINRQDITDETFREILDCEIHHDHPIVEIDGVYRWKQNYSVRQLVDKCGLNELVELFYRLGYNKNSEIFRKMYRDMGYSLYGYWEIFYWEMNNEQAQDYIEGRKALNRDLKINQIIK